MEQIYSVIKDFSILYLFLVIVSDLLSETQLNRYLRFFAGVLFVIMLCSSGFQRLTGKEVVENMSREYVNLEFLEQLEYEGKGFLEWEGGNDYAVNVLIQAYNQTIAEKGYEIRQFECKKTLDGKLEYLWLFVEPLESNGRLFGAYSEETNGAKECRKLIDGKWKMEFELKVYGRE